jgi:dGTPase
VVTVTVAAGQNGDVRHSAGQVDWLQRGTVRAELEVAELRTLAPWAAKAATSAGRATPEPEDPVRTCWMRDLDRIIFSRAMMRAHGKTQSFIPAFSEAPPPGAGRTPPRGPGSWRGAGGAARRGAPYIGDHFVTRATHMQHTARIAAAIARSLALNEPLATAIATGHDLGHACFGHGGEAALEEVAPNGFDHARQGARLLSLLEPRNLTAEVLDGIANHSWKHQAPGTLEGVCARIADRIAYLTADLADALRAEVLTRVEEVPAAIRAVLGETPSDTVGRLVEDVIRHSRGVPQVVQGEDCAQAMAALRSFMFERVYLRPEAVAQTERARRLLRDLYAWYLEHPETMPTGACLADDPPEQQAVDAIAGMTDRYALAAWQAAVGPHAT